MCYGAGKRFNGGAILSFPSEEVAQKFLDLPLPMPGEEEVAQEGKQLRKINLKESNMMRKELKVLLISIET